MKRARITAPDELDENLPPSGDSSTSSHLHTASGHPEPMAVNPSAAPPSILQPLDEISLDPLAQDPEVMLPNHEVSLLFPIPLVLVKVVNFWS